MAYLNNTSNLWIYLYDYIVKIHVPDFIIYFFLSNNHHEVIFDLYYCSNVHVTR